MAGFISSFFSARSIAAFVMAAMLTVSTAYAQDTDDAAPAPKPRLGGKRAQERLAQPVEPLETPEGAPGMERSGDDLIVHYYASDRTIVGFFKGMREGEGRTVTLGLPGRGECAVQVDHTAKVVAITCP